jgi:hypothetical protein
LVISPYAIFYTYGFFLTSPSVKFTLLLNQVLALVSHGIRIYQAITMFPYCVLVVCKLWFAVVVVLRLLELKKKECLAVCSRCLLRKGVLLGLLYLWFLVGFSSLFEVGFSMPCLWVFCEHSCMPMHPRYNLHSVTVNVRHTCSKIFVIFNGQYHQFVYPTLFCHLLSLLYIEPYALS